MEPVAESVSILWDDNFWHLVVVAAGVLACVWLLAYELKGKKWREKVRLLLPLLVALVFGALILVAIKWWVL